MEGEKTPRTVLITKQFAEHQLSKKNLIWEGEPKRREDDATKALWVTREPWSNKTENDKMEHSRLYFVMVVDGYPFLESKAGGTTLRKFKLNFLFTFNVHEWRSAAVRMS